MDAPLLCLHFMASHAVANYLSKGFCGFLDFGCMTTIGMTKSFALPLPELFDLILRQIVTGKVEKAVKEELRHGLLESWR
jgi:hypothetical protein